MVFLNQGGIYYMLVKEQTTLCCIFKVFEIAVEEYKLLPFVYANKTNENPRRIICRILFMFKRLYKSNMSSFLH